MLHWVHLLKVLPSILWILILCYGHLSKTATPETETPPIKHPQGQKSKWHLLCGYDKTVEDAIISRYSDKNLLNLLNSRRPDITIYQGKTWPPN